jgi:hypothetical protein
LLVCGDINGPLSGLGSLCFLKKTQGVWHLINTTMLWEN